MVVSTALVCQLLSPATAAAGSPASGEEVAYPSALAVDPEGTEGLLSTPPEEGAPATSTVLAFGSRTLSFPTMDEAGDTESGRIVTFTVTSTIVSGTISQNTTWTVAQSPYVLQGTVTVGSGARLTIEPGVVVKSLGGSLKVDGTLLASGTANDRITLTSLKDDAHGGDTNGDGASTSPARGDWQGVNLNAATAASQLSRADVIYGGSGSVGGLYPGLMLAGSPTVSLVTVSESAADGITVKGSPSISDSTVQGTSGYGIYTLSGASPSISGCTVIGSANDGVRVNSGSTPTLTNTTLSGNVTAVRLRDDANPTMSNTSGSGNVSNAIVITGTRSIASTLTLPVQPLCYLASSYTLNSGATLQLQPGVVIKTTSTSNFKTHGKLIGNGTASAPIVFTSLKDDAHGGDTNGDGGASSPARGDWQGLNLSSTTAASQLTYVEIIYGGSGSVGGGYPGLWLAGSPSVSHVSVSESAADGVSVAANGSPSISDSTIKNVGGYGVCIGTNSRPSITRSQIHGAAQTGIRNYSAAVPGPSIQYSDVHANGGLNIANMTAVPIEARYNYWGGFLRSHRS